MIKELEHSRALSYTVSASLGLLPFGPWIVATIVVM
jgi:hypothetical protein